MKRNIVVAGLGLIGGSLAMSIKKTNNNHVIGFDTNRDTVDYAYQQEIINEKCFDLSNCASNADLIILAAPISQTIKLLEELDKITFKKDVIITDVSSVKGTIIEAAKQLTNEKITFIGGHPMAGSHKTGIVAAKEHLFENAIYCLTPVEDHTKEAIKLIKEVLKETKSNFIILKPDEHDEMTSVISHFPHLVASSLVHQAKKWEQVHSYLPELAAGGFRDITRIASSNPKMWQDIFSHNGDKMSRLIQEWINEMVTLKEFLDKNNKTEMITYLEQAKNYRDGLGRDTKSRGALPSFYDIYVDIKDKPGSIATVAQLLAENDISIRNIRILEIRENIDGALRLTVFSEKDQLKTVSLLESNNYDVSISL